MSCPNYYVTVKFRPYLADYLKHYYGEHPIKAKEESKILPMLSRYLTHPPVPYRNIPECPGTVVFHLPYNKMADIRKLNYISPRHFRKIESFFYGFFVSHYIDYMNEQCIKLHKPIKASIISFMFQNEISLDRFQYDSLKRIYHRYRKDFFK